MYLLDQHNTMSELVDSEIDIVKDEIPHDDDNLDINNLLERIKKKEGKILQLSFWLQRNSITSYLNIHCYVNQKQPQQDCL